VPMYNFLAYFGVIPQPGLAMRLIWEVHFVPFSIVYAR
jgi:hypothetical protein